MKWPALFKRNRARLSAERVGAELVLSNEGPGRARRVIVVEHTGVLSSIREIERRDLLRRDERLRVHVGHELDEEARILVYWHDGRGAQELVVPPTGGLG